jgi:hypothetical protein
MFQLEKLDFLLPFRWGNLISAIFIKPIGDGRAALKRRIEMAKPLYSTLV